MMKKFFVFLGVFCFFTAVNATVHTEKTFMLSKQQDVAAPLSLYSHQDYLAQKKVSYPVTIFRPGEGNGERGFAKTILDMTYTFSKKIFGGKTVDMPVSKKKQKERHASLRTVHLQSIPFYSHSTNERGLGRYFGLNKSNVITFGQDTTVAGVDFDSDLLIHDPTAGGTPVTGNLELRPDRERFGVHADWLQRLSFISKNLFFNISVPVTHIEHQMNPRVFDESEGKIDTTGDSKGLLDYFSGNLEQTQSTRIQEKLKFAKIAGSHSKTGVEDVVVSFAYQPTARSRKDYFVRSIHVSIPTGNKPTGEFLFEPILGNAGKWGVGVSIEDKIKLYENDNWLIDVVTNADLTAFFSNTQKRTIGMRTHDNQVIGWSQHYLLGENGIKGVKPAANILTRDVDVSSYITFDTGIGFDIHYKKLLFNVGYNFFARSAETVSVKSWPEDTYGVVTREYLTTDNFDSGEIVGAFISKSMLETGCAETPDVLTHKFSGALSYVFDGSCPFMLGLGGAYEFIQRNAGLQNYEIFAITRFSF